jgi:hypothetical protein
VDAMRSFGPGRDGDPRWSHGHVPGSFRIPAAALGGAPSRMSQRERKATSVPQGASWKRNGAVSSRGPPRPPVGTVLARGGDMIASNLIPDAPRYVIVDALTVRYTRECAGAHCHPRSQLNWPSAHFPVVCRLSNGEFQPLCEICSKAEAPDMWPIQDAFRQSVASQRGVRY